MHCTQFHRGAQGAAFASSDEQSPAVYLAQRTSRRHIEITFHGEATSAAALIADAHDQAALHGADQAARGLADDSSTRMAFACGWLEAVIEQLVVDLAAARTPKHCHRSRS